MPFSPVADFAAGFFIHFEFTQENTLKTCSETRWEMWGL